MNELPRYAISVRQPWAWAIIHAGKHLENRSPVAVKHMRGVMRSGPLAIHAAKGMTRDEYESARDFMVSRMLVKHDAFPSPDKLVRGAVIGSAHFDDVLTHSASPWWIGPRALVLSKQTPLAEPIPCVGALGFFEWRNGLDGDPRTYTGYREPKLEEPKPWMLAWPADLRASREKIEAARTDENGTLI